MTGSIVNIILDPILIYGLFGVSAMGVKGAAYATVAGQIAAFILAYSLNVIFVMASESLVTVYGLYYKIQQFVIMTAFGLRDATMPIISFTYGTGNKKRLKESIKYLQLYTFIIMLVGTVLFELLV